MAAGLQPQHGEGRCAPLRPWRMRRNLPCGVHANLQPPNACGRQTDEAGMLEGALETRGPGKVGRWEQRWFRLEGAVLASFATADASTAQQCIPIREISSLSFERNKCECIFTARGTKVRLRAETERLAWIWFRSLLETVQLGTAGCEDYSLPSGHQDYSLPSARQGSSCSSAAPSWGLEGLHRLPLTEQELFQRQPVRSPSPPCASAESCFWTPRAAPSTPRPGEEPRAKQGKARSLEPPARCVQLHSLHEARLQRFQELKRRTEARERKRIASERDAALKIAGRAGMSPERNPQEVADKLFNDHRAAQERAAILQRRVEDEEREALNRTRFRRQGGTAGGAAGREAGERLHREHRQREERRREREERAARTVGMLMESSSSSSACGSTSRHLELYGHAQSRSWELDRRRREKEEAEMGRLADLTVHKRRGPADSGRFEHLYAEHEVRSRRLAERQELKRRTELAHVQELQQALKEANIRSWSRWSPRRGRLDLSHGSSDEERSRCASPRSKAEACQRSLQAERGRLAESERASRRPSPEPAAPEDVLLVAVLSAVQARCGGPTGSTAALKQLAMPLKAAMAAYKEAVAACAQGEGHAALCARPSQQLFHDSRLLPETDGWRSCVEPNPIRQVEEDLDSLLSSAAKAQAALQRLIAPSHDGAPWAAGTSRASPGAVPWALFAHNPGPKLRAAAELKAFVLFQPAAGDRRYRHLLDLARLSLVFANCRLLLDGLDRIISQFEVLDVRNHFHAPSRIGERCVEVLLAVEVDVGGLSMPHVCELRLEEHAFYAARIEATQHVERFLSDLREQYAQPSRNVEACMYLVRRVLATPSESHGLRILRRHLARRFGSCVACWRQALGGRRQLNFRLFRDVCNSLKLREHAPAYWSELEPGRSGCISLLELDPEALGLLLRMRGRMMALLGFEALSQDQLFQRLTVNIKLASAGRMQAGEFRNLGRACGLSPEESDRAFGFLECKGDGTVTPADLWWLACLPALVDTQAALLEAEAGGDRFVSGGLRGRGPVPPAVSDFAPGCSASLSPRTRPASAAPPARVRQMEAPGAEDCMSTAARRGQSAPAAPSSGERVAAAALAPAAPAWGGPPLQDFPSRFCSPGALAGRLSRHAWDRPRLAGDQHLGFSHGFWPTLEEVGEGEEPSPEPLAAPSPGSHAADSPRVSSRGSSPVEPPALWPDEPRSGLPPEARQLLSTSRSSATWASPWAGWEGAQVEEENPLEVF